MVLPAQPHTISTDLVFKREKETPFDTAFELRLWPRAQEKQGLLPA